MAAVVFTVCPSVKTQNPLGATNVATQFTKPAGAKRAVVSFDTNPGKVAYQGTDGAAIGVDYMPVPANSPMEFNVEGVGSIFCAAATASTVVHVAFEKG